MVARSLIEADWWTGFWQRHPEIPLSPREREIAILRLFGRSDAEIAAELFVSKGTVKRHDANILLKLNLTSVREIPLFLLQLVWRDRLVGAAS